MTPDELREQRQALGLSQTAIAERLGVPLNTWWRWESGRMPVAHPMILRLALKQLGAEAGRAP